jgi:hypothetical protein
VRSKAAMAAAAPQKMRQTEAALELSEPKHACRLSGHLGSELGSERFSDVVVVLASHRPAAHGAQPPPNSTRRRHAFPSTRHRHASLLTRHRHRPAAPNPPSCSTEEEGAVAVEAAIEGGAAGSMAGGRRLHAHALVLALSPVWLAQLGDDNSFRPLPREGARKARRRPGEGGGGGWARRTERGPKACPGARPVTQALPHPQPHSTGTAQ